MILQSSSPPPPEGYGQGKLALMPSPSQLREAAEVEQSAHCGYEAN